MTDTATAPAAADKVELPSIPPIDVTRGEVTLQFVVQADTKGLGKGNPFMAPDPAKMPSLVDTIKWVNNDSYLAKKVWSPLKKVLKEAYNSAKEKAIGEDGLFSTDKFTLAFNAEMANLKFVSETIKQLNGQIAELTNKAIAAGEAGTAEAFSEVKSILAQIKSLKEMVESKSRVKDDDDDDADEQTPAA